MCPLKTQGICIKQNTPNSWPLNLWLLPRSSVFWGLSHSQGKAWFIHCLEISSVPPREHTNKKKVKTYKSIFQENVAMKRKRQRTSSVWISKYKENLYKQTSFSKGTSAVHSTGHEILGCCFQFGGESLGEIPPSPGEGCVCSGPAHATLVPAGCSSYRGKQPPCRINCIYPCDSSRINRKFLLV